MTQAITVRELIEALRKELRLELLCGESALERPIVTPLIQKPGLVLTGMFEYLQPARIQVLGRSELRYLTSTESRQDEVIDQLCRDELPMILITRALEPPPKLISAIAAHGIPLVRCESLTAEAIEILGQYLHVALAPRAQRHGVMMDMFGIGVLILGDSGIGKSECALELLSRGHRLVADDAVEMRRIEGEIVANSPDVTQNLMEVRGLGIIDVREMFGIGAVRASKVIELVIALIPLEPQSTSDRLGSGEGRWNTLDVDLPQLRVPVAPGRNVAVLVEMAVEQHLSREAGSRARHDLQAVIARRIARNRSEEEA